MSLQWHSPPQTRVAAWVQASCGRSATEPFVDPLSSTATPSAFVSGLDGNPASTTTPARKSSRQRSITRSHGSRRARRIRLVRSLAYRRPSPSRRCGVTSICTPLRPGIRGIITLSSLALKRQGRRIRTATFVAGRQTSKPAKQVLLHASTPARTHTCAHSSSKHLPLQACVCVRCKRARSDFFDVQKFI